jgi:hypothetical protein
MGLARANREMAGDEFDEIGQDAERPSLLAWVSEDSRPDRQRSPTGQGWGQYEITLLQSGFVQHRVLDRNLLAFVQTVAQNHEGAFDTEI